MNSQTEAELGRESLITYQRSLISGGTLAQPSLVMAGGRVVTFTFLQAIVSECPSRTRISAHCALQTITVKNKDLPTLTGYTSIENNVFHRENIL